MLIVAIVRQTARKINKKRFSIMIEPIYAIFIFKKPKTLEAKYDRLYYSEAEKTILIIIYVLFDHIHAELETVEMRLV